MAAVVTGCIAGHVFAVQIARGEDLQRGENQAGNYAYAHKYARMVG